MPWCLCKVAFPTISIGNLAAYEITARQAGAVDILRIAVLALVEVVLIGIEEVLHAGIHLERHSLIERDVVGYLQVHVEEVGRRLFPILGDVARHVLHEHTASVSARKRDAQGFPWREGRGEIAVQVGGAEHSLLRGDAGVFAPRRRLLIPATLDSHARLKLHPSIRHLPFEVHAHDAGSRTVTALHDLVALLVRPLFLQIEDVAQVGIEPFRQQIQLDCTQAAVEIDGGTEALGLLFA